MIHQVMAIFDSGVKAYARPAFYRSVDQGIRAFKDACAAQQGQDSELAAHPEDFSLWHLGQFDDDKGQFTNLELPKQIMTGRQARLIPEPTEINKQGNDIRLTAR